MVASNALHNQHLLWRSGFGPQAEDISLIYATNSKQLFKKIYAASSAAPSPLLVSESVFPLTVKVIQNLSSYAKMGREERSKLLQESRDAIKKLNLLWLNEMTHSQAQLREKMAFFWHGHFATRENNIIYQQQLLEIIRRDGLSDFGTLLRGVSKSASMLAFLNNQQNRKSHPNENFAREVMELFTIGRGNYTEQDVKESARAFTGWGFKVNGEFVSRPNFHDAGTKIIFGKTGNFTGDDVINMLLEKKETAFFITQKILKNFVNDSVSTEEVHRFSDKFYQSGYKIDALMEDIFTSSWFYEKKNIGVKIKSPIELIVGIRRFLPIEFENEEVQLLYQRLLGQVLFYPPNVAGWPGGKSWIDSSTLMYRLKIPRMLHDNSDDATAPKQDDDIMMGQMEEKRKRNVAGKVNVTINWKAVLSRFDNTSRHQLPEKLVKEVLLSGNADISKMTAFADSSSKSAYIQTAIIALMSTPEYQLM
jgi:uncharacterized protein (DUF1800 family)